MSDQPPAPSPPPSAQPAPPSAPALGDRDRLSRPTRQSPFAPVFLLMLSVRQFALNIGFLVAFSTWGRLFWLIPIIVVVALLVAVARWWRSTFQIVDDELIVEQGVFSRERKTIPLVRIQSVTIEQRLLHRLFGLVEARVETAGSAEAEFTLEAVTRPVAESIRRLATEHNTVREPGLDGTSTAAIRSDDDSSSPYDSAIPPAPGSPGQPRGDAGESVVLSRSTLDILKVAISSNPLVGFGATAAAIAGIASLIDDRVSDDKIEDLFSNAWGSPVLLGAGLLVLVILFVIASLIAAMVPLHELTLFRTANGFRSASGLLSRRERVAPLERIQLVSTSQNPVQRLLHIQTVSLPTAGTTSDDGSQITLPGTTESEYAELLKLLVPDQRPSANGALNGIAPDAIGHWTLWWGVVPAAAISIQLAIFFKWFGLFALLLIVPAYLLARRAQRNWGWTISDEALRITRGAFTRRGGIMPLRKTQTVMLRRSLFHRRRGLASVKIASAAGALVVPHLPLDRAAALRDELLLRCETDPRPFM